MTTQTLNTTASPSTPFIKRVLAVDALACAGAGLLMTLGNGPFAEFLGLQTANVFNLMTGPNFVAFLGIDLLIIAAWVGWNASREAVDTRQVKAIIAANTAWSVASFLLLVTNTLPLSTLGGWFIMLQADVVLLVAIAEFVGLRRLKQ